MVLLGADAGAQSVPSDWTTTDIGAPTIPGYATFSGGTYSISGSGSDIGGTADQFTFVHRMLTGDGAIVARIESLDNTDPWAKAGVMIRQSLSAGSRNAAVLVSPSNGIAFQRRWNDGAATTSTTTPSVGAPVWLKLERRANIFTASWSTNGLTWTVIGSDMLWMNGRPVYVGLAVTSHNTAASAMARFTDVLATSLMDTGGPLPSDWSSVDVGNPPRAGAAVYDPGTGTFGLEGAGVGISETSDEFRFAYIPVNSDVDIAARVRAIGDADAWSKAGVMIRESLAPNAVHASLFVSHASGAAFQRRSQGGGTTVSTVAANGRAPLWIKLSLRNGTVSAYRSPDGTMWTPMGSEALVFPSPFYVGLAVTSHDATSSVIANIDSVRIEATASNQPPAVSLTAPSEGALYIAPATITISADAADADGTVTRVDFYEGSTLLASDTDAPFTITWEDVPDGWYSLTAVAADNAGAAATSASRTISVSRHRTATFGASTDHDLLVTSYLLEIFPDGVDPSYAAPIRSQDLGKPAVVDGDCVVDVTATIGPLAAGTYQAVLSAIGPGGTSRAGPMTFAR